MGTLLQRTRASRRRRCAPNRGRAFLVPESHRDRSMPAGDRRGLAGRAAHGNQHRPHVRTRLGSLGGHGRRRRSAGLDVSRHLSASRSQLGVTRFRCGGDRRLRQHHGRVLGWPDHRPGADRGRLLHLAKLQVAIRVFALPAAGANPAVRADGQAMRWLPAAALLALAFYPLVYQTPFPQHIVIMALLFATLGTAWNILGGIAGQVSFGHALYFGIGAYTCAWFYKIHALSALVTWPAALALSTLAAVCVGLPTFRLRGHYFVLASVFIMQAVYIVVSNWTLLGAAIGLELPVHKPTGALDALWHLQFHMSKLPFYYGALALFVATLITFEWTRRSRVGLLLAALR